MSFLVDLITEKRARLDLSDGDGPKCPVNDAICGRECFLRRVCQTRPADLVALMERLDAETERAMVEYVQRLR